MPTSIRSEPERAYLEMARASLNVAIEKPKTQENEPEPDGSMVLPTPNTYLAIAAKCYVFSYMAVTAWANRQIGSLWHRDDSSIRDQYSDVDSLEELLRKDLGETKDVIKAVNKAHGIAPLSQEEPRTWNDLCQVLREVRHFFIHPVPDPELFDKIMTEALNERTWDFPTTVAEDTIAYTYKQAGLEIPEWVTQNQEFTIPSYYALGLWNPDA